MKLSARLLSWLSGVAGVVAMWLLVPDARAQNPFAQELEATIAISNTLNEGAVAPSQTALDRTRGVVGQVNSPAQGRGGRISSLTGGRSVGEVVDDVLDAIVEPTFKAYVGRRVRDAVTKELLDDPQLIWIPESETVDFFDDGNIMVSGDLIEGDEEFAKVEFVADVVGQTTQRIKERTIQALNQADMLDPVEFYGFTLMSTDAMSRPARKSRWQIIDDPDGGIGFRLAELPTEKEVDVPKYRDWLEKKDTRLTNWATEFLSEYRVDSEDLTSEFYPLYIPQPPPPPFTSRGRRIKPPTEAGWQPFPNAGVTFQAGDGGGPATGGNPTTGINYLDTSAIPGIG